jgi:hypothetical protein
MAEFQVRINRDQFENVELNRETLAEIVDELDENERPDKTFAALPIICQMILKFHGGLFYNTQSGYIDYEMYVNFQSFNNDIVKAQYVGCINRINGDSEWIQSQEFTGDITIMDLDW